jgi:hypothetical protein
MSGSKGKDGRWPKTEKLKRKKQTHVHIDIVIYETKKIS